MLLLRLTLVLYLILGGTATLYAIDWPITLQDQSPSIGNSYGEYQYYGSYSYLHPGIDILAPAGTPVYAAKAGYVKAVLTISADLHWRVAIGDSAGAEECDGWLYAHLRESTISVNEGDWVEEGQYLGDLVSWPIANFHHLHFVKIRNSGIVWSSDWEFIGNPLDELEEITDIVAPQFVNAFGTQLFAFCQNESESYFMSGESLSGDVDIICRTDDLINHTWKVAPYRLEYKIEGDSTIPWTNSFCFTGNLNWNANVETVFQDDAFCNSRGDYDDRVFYFNLTNTDGDSLIEESDRSLAWQTAYFHNGSYTVYARASDKAGNITVESMPVTVENYFTLNGTVICSDNNPELGGTVTAVNPSGQTGTTDSDAYYSIAMIGGGSQSISISRPGYVTFDTVLMMNQHHQLNVVLDPVDFVAGDANYDSEVNVGDAVSMIYYIFREGPAPAPYSAGDINSDGEISVGDAVYLVNYIFRDGPPPDKNQPSLWVFSEFN